MRKSILLLLLVTSCFMFCQSQEIPAGMKYQAVARNLNGDVIGNRAITLHVELKSNPSKTPVVYYSEEHVVRTNQFGLFDLVVGNGKTIKGIFAEIPWSSENIWMHVSMKEGSGFTAVSESRLLAVPYAFHAGTATKLAGGNIVNANTPGVPANVWSLKGNSNTNPAVDKLGTTDFTDLILVTNNIERFKITAAGDINIANSLKVGVDVEVGNDLYVKKNVYLNTVSGATTNNGSFTVANTSPTVLTGTLRTDNTATFKQQVLIDNAGLGSASSATGGLVVAGGAGIGQNLFLGNNLNVGGNAFVNQRIGVNILYSNAGLNVTTIGADLPFNFEVSGSVNKFQMGADGQIYHRSNQAGDPFNTGNYAYMMDAQNQGLLIRLNEQSYPDAGNHYVSFWGSTNVIRGRIEGQTPDELHNSFDYIWTSAMGLADEAFIIAEGIATAAQADAAEAVVMAVEGVVVFAKWVEFTINADLKVGVAYESGSGDYAEWLEKSNYADNFSFGDIVSIYGGKVSKNTMSGGRLLVVSMSPIVLGNTPPNGMEKNFERIAFMGQVPVKVRGAANVGDYIIASGLNDGFGIAVHPSKMTLADYKNVVGIAWSESLLQKGVSYVTVAVGLNNNDLVGQLEKQQKEITALEGQLKTILEYLHAKDPSFEADKIKTAPMVTSNPEPVNRNSEPMVFNSTRTATQLDYVNKLINEKPELITAGLAKVRETFEAKGLDISKYPELQRLFTDREFLHSEMRRIMK